MSKHDFDLIVIGSGGAGGVAAHYAARLNKKVLVVEKGEMGGECPNIGCVPTKALLQAAEVLETVKGAGQFGVEVSKVGFDYHKVQAWKDLVVSRTGTTEGEAAFREAGIQVLREPAIFTRPNQIMVGHKFYTARKFIIATGSANAVPPIPGLKEAGFIDFEGALSLKTLPKSIFIIGGGPIGCEFAQIFSSFGVKVHIADSLPTLLGREDKDAGALLGEVFKDRGINVITEAQIHQIQHAEGGKAIHFSLHGHHRALAAEEILVATGKRPNVQLGLEAAGVKYDSHGIKVNTYMQTNVDHIYAAGDVTGPFLFTHTAVYQGNIAAHNAFSASKIRANYHNVPRCTFTKPEIASVGLSEDEAKAQGIKIKVGSAPLSMIGRANTSNEGVGFAKIMTDQRGKIVGGVVVSPRAGELIHEITLAIQLGATAHEVATTIHAFPTFSDLVRFAARDAG